MAGDRGDWSDFMALTREEARALIVCLFLDVIEFVLEILLFPGFGDVLDIIGFVLCVRSFGWIGVLSLLEFVPGLDFLPVYIVTWLVWYVARRTQAERSNGGS